MNRLIVVGLGNEMRGDDAAGLLAARELRAIAPAGVDVEEQSGDLGALAEAMTSHPEMVVVDAVVAGVPPGSVLELTPDRDVNRSRSSSHGLGLSDALALARVLGADPHVRVIGIAGSDFAPGSKPTAAVARAAREVARMIAAEAKVPRPCA